MEQEAPDLAEHSLLGGDADALPGDAEPLPPQVAGGAVAAASSGPAPTRSSAWWRNPSSSRAWIGRCRRARSRARVLGNRHAASETNSRVVISTNHQDP